MQKKSSLILIIFAIVLIFGCSNSQSGDSKSQTITGNKVNLEVDGYTEICNLPSVYIKEEGSWKLANRNLPRKGQYYLDEKYYGYGTCDYSTCNKIPNPYTIELVEYRKIGEKEAEDNTNYMAPVFETTELKGDIKVEFEYFSDDKCKNKKFFSEVIRK